MGSGVSDAGIDLVSSGAGPTASATAQPGGVTALEPTPTASRPPLVPTIPTPLTAAQKKQLAREDNLRRERNLGERWPTPPQLLTGYQWPLPHGRITQPFGPSWAGTLIIDGQLAHDGLDIATFCGDHVVAAHDGIVIAAGRKVDPWMGWIGSLAPSVKRRDTYHLWYTLPIIVVVDDGNGYRSIYAHFNKLAVKRGQHVKAGQFLGWEGATGFATGCHVHYGLFSPLETARFQLNPPVAARTKLPKWEIARVDPLLVLPPR